MSSPTRIPVPVSRFSKPKYLNLVVDRPSRGETQNHEQMASLVKSRNSDTLGDCSHYESVRTIQVSEPEPLGSSFETCSQDDRDAIRDYGNLNVIERPLEPVCATSSTFDTKASFQPSTTEVYSAFGDQETLQTVPNSEKLGIYGAGGTSDSSSSWETELDREVSITDRSQQNRLRYVNSTDHTPPRGTVDHDATPRDRTPTDPELTIRKRRQMLSPLPLGRTSTRFGGPQDEYRNDYSTGSPVSRRQKAIVVPGLVSTGYLNSSRHPITGSSFRHENISRHLPEVSPFSESHERAFSDSSSCYSEVSSLGRSYRQTSERLRSLNRAAVGVLQTQTQQKPSKDHGSSYQERKTSESSIPSNTTPFLRPSDLENRRITPPPRRSSVVIRQKSPLKSPRRGARVLYPPESKTTKIHLRVIKEELAMDTLRTRSQWVAIDIKNDVESSRGRHGVVKVDAIVVLDNTYYPSAATIHESSETIDYIAGKLKEYDRLALLVTEDGRLNALDMIALPIQPVRRHILRKVLDNVEHNTKKPESGYLNNAVSVALEILFNVEKDDKRGPVGRTNGHIFIFTPNSSAFTSPKVDPAIQIHMICAAPVPWKSSKMGQHNGWSITRGHRTPSGKARGITNEFFQDIDNLIEHAHAGNCCTLQTDVSLGLEMASYCKVRRTMGTGDFAVLHPGETGTVLFEIAQDPVHEPSLWSQLNQFPIGYTLPSGEPDVQMEINNVLKSDWAPLFHCSLSYKNPAFAGSTITEAPYCASASIGTPHKNSGHAYVAVEGFNSEPYVAILKRKVYHIATKYHPNLARRFIQEEFNKPGIRDDLANFVAEVLNELRHQGRAADAMAGFDADPKYMDIVEPEPSIRVHQTETGLREIPYNQSQSAGNRLPARQSPVFTHRQGPESDFLDASLYDWSLPLSTTDNKIPPTTSAQKNLRNTKSRLRLAKKSVADLFAKNIKIQAVEEEKKRRKADKAAVAEAERTLRVRNRAAPWEGLVAGR